MILLIFPLLFPTIVLGCASRDNYFKFVDYYPGSEDTNVILSAPHDGWIKLDSIPDRRQVRTAAIPVNFIYEEISLKALGILYERYHPFGCIRIRDVHKANFV